MAHHLHRYATLGASVLITENEYYAYAWDCRTDPSAIACVLAAADTQRRHLRFYRRSLDPCSLLFITISIRGIIWPTANSATEALRAFASFQRVLAWDDPDKIDDPASVWTVGRNMMAPDLMDRNPPPSRPKSHK